MKTNLCGFDADKHPCLVWDFTELTTLERESNAGVVINVYAGVERKAMCVLKVKQPYTVLYTSTWGSLQCTGHET